MKLDCLIPACACLLLCSCAQMRMARMLRAADPVEWQRFLPTVTDADADLIKRLETF